MEGQGETKSRFYRRLGASEGTQRDRERHPVAVRIAVKLVSYKRPVFERQGLIRGDVASPGLEGRMRVLV
jgi:hypothetical protein